MTNVSARLQQQRIHTSISQEPMWRMPKEELLQLLQKWTPRRCIPSNSQHSCELRGSRLSKLSVPGWQRRGKNALYSSATQPHIHASPPSGVAASTWLVATCIYFHVCALGLRAPLKSTRLSGPTSTKWQAEHHWCTQGEHNVVTEQADVESGDL